MQTVEKSGHFGYRINGCLVVAWCAAEKRVVTRMMFPFSLYTSQGLGTTDRDRVTGEATDLAQESKGGSRAGEKVESFSEIPAKIEK